MDFLDFKGFLCERLLSTSPDRSLYNHLKELVALFNTAFISEQLRQEMDGVLTVSLLEMFLKSSITSTWVYLDKSTKSLQQRDLRGRWKLVVQSKLMVTSLNKVSVGVGGIT